MPSAVTAMEEEAEKMVALKRAFADIILNTAKEAAARVMVSERKSLGFQKDLSSTKDESLQMLVRLKQMIDAKTSKSEVASLSQRRRIEELEGQIDEAEGIIIDLRVELREAQHQLNMVKSSQLQSSETCPELMINSELNPRILLDTNCCNFAKDSTMSIDCEDDRNFIMKSESNLNGEMENMVVKPEDSSGVDEVRVSNKYVKVLKMRRRRRKPRNGNAKATLCKHRFSQPMKLHPEPEKINNKVETLESAQAVRRSLRERKVKSWDDFAMPNGSLTSRSKTDCGSRSLLSRCNSAKSGEDNLKLKSKGGIKIDVKTSKSSDGYTLSRKRKKEELSEPENSCMKRRSEDKQNDSEQLMLVAHQLISLSEEGR